MRGNKQLKQKTAMVKKESTKREPTRSESKVVSLFAKKPYAKVLTSEEDGTYSAKVLELAGCFAEGDTPAEAIENLDRAATEWIEVSVARGHEIPDPIDSRGYSGTISLRLPSGLHKRAAMMAEHNGVSLNQFLVSAISAAVGAGDLYSRFVDRMTSSARAGWGGITRVANTVNLVNFQIVLKDIPGTISLSETRNAPFLSFFGEVQKADAGIPVLQTEKAHGRS